MSAQRKTRKSSRKSRRLRVQVSASSEWQQFEPSHQDWLSMEAAIGRPVADDLRAEIVKIVQKYFRMQPFEANAPFLDDVLKHLRAVTKSAKQLKGALRAPSPNGAGDVVRAYLVQGFGEARPDAIEAMEADLDRLSEAAMLAEKDFLENSHRGFSEGDAWQEMVRSLKNLMRSFSMPAGASNDSSKAKALTGSPFVRFIQALQKTFPLKLCRHHLSTPFALAGEINRAARSGRLKNGTLA